MEPVYFSSPTELRDWFTRHHEDTAELLVGYHKRGTGRPSVTWSESVDQALCFGWIDGVRRRVDDERYTVRFTPRKAGSVWSAVNIAKVADLTSQGLMTPAGVRAFAARRSDRSEIYAYEQRRDAALDADQSAVFRADTAAWDWFSVQPPSYRRAAAYWVTSAKRPETSERRLRQLIADSRAGRTIPPLTRRTGTT
jgi:uncharacterized protein YdeI (YjbR/CyaY-like superfamily)